MKERVLCLKIDLHECVKYDILYLKSSEEETKMDNIKEKLEEIVEKIKNDKNLMKKFQDDPVTTIEGLIGIDLPNDQVEKLVDAVKAKVAVDGIGSLLGGLFGKK